MRLATCVCILALAGPTLAEDKVFSGPQPGETAGLLIYDPPSDQRVIVTVVVDQLP